MQTGDAEPVLRRAVNALRLVREGPREGAQRKAGQRGQTVSFTSAQRETGRERREEGDGKRKTGREREKEGDGKRVSRGRRGDSRPRQQKNDRFY